MSLKKPARHRAFSLIESAIVLGIVGLVIGVLWVAASDVMERHKVNRTVQQITHMVNCVRNLVTPTEIPSTDTPLFVERSGCLLGDSRRINASSGYKVTTAYWDYVHLNITGNGEFSVNFFSNSAAPFTGKKCNIMINALVNAFGSSGDPLLRIRVNTSGGYVTYLPAQLPYSVSPNKCGDDPVLYFSIPLK